MRIPFLHTYKRTPAPPGLGAGKLIPEESANIFSRLVFQWLMPLLDVGHSRPLEKEDLWELPQNRLTETLTNEVERNFYTRCSPEKRPRHLQHHQNDGECTAESEPKDDHGNMDHSALDEEEVLGLLKPTSPSHPEGPRTRYQARKTPVSPSQRGWREWSPSLKTGEKDKTMQYDQSLYKAIYRTFTWPICVSGGLKLISDTMKTTTPILNKVILQWLIASYSYHHLTDEEKASLGTKKPQGIGFGIGLAIALYSIAQIASLLSNHYIRIASTTGLSIRTAVVGNIFRKSLRISGRARVEHNSGQITTMISTDAARLDQFSVYAHNLWIAPIQLIVGFALLISNLGYSALVGIAALVLGLPIQILLVRVLFSQRQRGVKVTDKRARLTTEVLQGIRLIKYYAWEDFYLTQIGKLRVQEFNTIRKSAVARSSLFAMVAFTPILASVLSFVTYAVTGHNLDIAIIFSSLQLFNIIRVPLIFLPNVLAALSDAIVALRRISAFLTAEELAEPYVLDPSSTVGVHVSGDFVWETVIKPKEEDDRFSLRGKKKRRHRRRHFHRGDGEKEWHWHIHRHREEEKTLPSSTQDLPKNEMELGVLKAEEKPFELLNLQLDVPKGSFVAIVGRVGSGKSSVLQALIGEMRRTRGEVVLGGTVAYAPQTPWIRNATVRQNILFGQEDDEERFRAVVEACSLERDLNMLPDGENTEIGEKGINLSGGQKARISLARAAYSKSEVVLLDDPLSAVDAYVGKSILENCLLAGPLANRTRILVTHTLHVLDNVDYIYVMDHGKIVEQGSYEALTANSVILSHLIEEYGGLESDTDGEDSHDEEAVVARQNTLRDHSRDVASSKATVTLIQSEERNTGSVSWDVYKKYLRFAGGLRWGPIIVLLLILTQIATLGNNVFLGFWTAGSIRGFKQEQYMAVYASLGLAQAILTFFLSFAFSLAGLFGSLNLFKAALSGVLRSAVSFFDTTPLGRILARLSKDQDTLDVDLPMSSFQFFSTFSSVLGTIALVFYTFPILGVIFAPIAIMYYYLALYYRSSSVETKRLDSLLRSALYGSYAETLTGLATIRAYQEQTRAVQTAQYALDLENRAYYITIMIQRWLAIRLDLLGNILIFGIALFATGFRNKINPAVSAVVLSYTLSMTWTFSELVNQFAQNEQNMNAVERVLHYTELTPEGETYTPNDPPPPWPNQGKITFESVDFAYRNNLPLVLKGVSFQVNPGEKVGIIGRTGAGKSSILQALFRIAEIRDGKIEIDGVNTRNIGLDTLRGGLALVPQESTLFLGTLRENLDPRGLRTDAELISVLQRAGVLPDDGPVDPAVDAKFSLDSMVGDEGSNYSAGEKQLLALCRALIKNSRIIVLDEATSSVDVETDAKIQRTIQTEFASATLLCIAHRLNTIAYYDRILVMDAGKVAEYDTVMNLFDKEDSIFRSLCNEANLQRSDILKIRESHSTLRTA